MATMCSDTWPRLLALAFVLGLSGSAWAAPDQPIGAPTPPLANASVPDDAAWDREITALDESGRNGGATPAHSLGQLLARMPPDHPLRWKALVTRASWLGDTRQLDDLPDILAELQQLSQRQPEVAASVPLVQATMARISDQPQKAEALYESGLRQLQADSPPLLGYLLLGWAASIKEDRGQYDEAMALHRRQLALARNMGPSKHVQALLGLSYPLILAGQQAAAEDLVQQAYRLAQTHQDHFMLAKVYLTKTFHDSEVRKVAPRLSDMEAAVRHARLSRHPMISANALSNLADHWLRASQFSQALALSREALLIPGQQDNSVALGNQGLALIGLGRLDEGLRSVKAAMAQARKANDRVMEAIFGRDLAGFLERTGHLQEAVQAHAAYRELARQAAGEQQAQAVAALQEAHEAEERAHALDLLQRENQLKQDMLDREALVSRAVAASVILAALLLALASWLLRCLRRTNSALVHANERLHRLATEDLLTGLPNRRQILERVTSDRANPALAGAGLLLIDMDHFKRVNDALGHAAGDQVLVQSASRLRGELGAHDLLARWGGEEFLVISPHCTDAELANLVRRLLRALNHAPITVQGEAHRITASIGVARLPAGQQPLAWRDFDDALQQADQALYLAKAGGRNQAMAEPWLGALNDTDGSQRLPGLAA